MVNIEKKNNKKKITKKKLNVEQTRMRFVVHKFKWRHMGLGRLCYANVMWGRSVYIKKSLFEIKVFNWAGKASF